MLLKRTSIVTAFLLVSVTASSQQTSLSAVKAQLDTMFSSLDKSKVPTGFLWDTAVNLVEREDHNGLALTDSNIVSISLMEDLLYSINSSSVGADTVCVQAAIARLQRNSSPSQQMVGILFQTYNYIAENAVADDLIVYSNDRVSDSYIGGVWQNPYAEDVLFGYAIGGESSVSLNTTFTFTNIDSLSTLSLQSIQFDPGDGDGFRTATMGGRVTANYTDEGCYETRLKVTLGNREYLGHGLIYVFRTSSGPNHIYTPGYHSGYNYYSGFSTTFDGKTYRATVSYKEPLCFDNPLIVSEGFDPWKLADENSFHDYQGTTNIFTFKQNCPFYRDYDVFYIDWKDCGADIRANAELLKKVIRWINLNKTSGNKNVVLGQSMGGLIARYALKDMELHGELHDTRLFISHDVPYKGANVSPGLMYAYRDLYDITDNIIGDGYSLFGGNKEAFNEVRNFGSYTSVRQMLQNYVSPSWTYDNSVYNQFQEELTTMGFPQGDPGSPIENIAIVNGGNSPSSSPSLFSSGDKLVDLNFKVSSGVISEFLLSPLYLLISAYSKNRLLWLPGKSTLRFNYGVYPYLTNNSVVASSSLVFSKKFLWMIKKDYVLKSSSFNSPSSGVPLDAARSSFYEKPEELDHIIPTPDSNSNFWWGDYDYHFDITDRIAFIPVASAFASSDYSRDFRSNHPAPKTETPFTSYILPDTTTYHTDFYGTIPYWFEQVEGMSINGPLLPQNGDSYSMPSRFAPSFSWNTSNNSLVSLNSSGTISVNGFGLVDIIAQKDSVAYVVSKRKTILAGMPRMVLSSIHNGTQYTVRAEYADDGVEEFLSQTHLSDSIMRKWYLVVGEQAIDSTINYCDSAVFIVSNSVNVASVTLILNYNGRTSTPVHSVIKERRYYTWNVVDILCEENSIHYLRNFHFGADNDNPPYFKLKKNPNEPNVEWPAKLKATAGDSILRTSGEMVIIDNCAVWDLFIEPAIINYINSAYLTNEIKELTIDVYKDTEEIEANLVQTIVILIHPSLSPLPF